MGPYIIILATISLIVLISCIRVVPQANEYVIAPRSIPAVIFC